MPQLPNEISTLRSLKTAHAPSLTLLLGVPLEILCMLCCRFPLPCDSHVNFWSRAKQQWLDLFKRTNLLGKQTKLNHINQSPNPLAIGLTMMWVGLGSNNRFSDLKSIFIWMFRYRWIKSQDRSFNICIFPWMREVSPLVSRGQTLVPHATRSGHVRD